MMQQHLASIFSIVKEDKVFQFMCGSASFDEVDEVLEQFKKDFAELRKQHEEQQAKRKEESVVEPEVL